MGAFLGVRQDVGSFEDGQGGLAGDAAAALVGVGDDDLEAALPEARADEGGLAVALAFGLDDEREVVLARFDFAPESGARVW